METQACEGCTANILCFADVEDKYDITYVQREKYVVHLPGRDLEFHRRGKMYVAFHNASGSLSAIMFS